MSTVLSVPCTVDYDQRGKLALLKELWFELPPSDSEDLPKELRGKPLFGQYHKFKHMTSTPTQQGGHLKFKNLTTKKADAEFLKDQPALGDLKWLSLTR